MLLKFGKKSILYATICFAVVITFSEVYRAEFIRWVDIKYFNEGLRDSFASIFSDEDWLTREDLSSNLDYGWLEIADKPILIAHALGAAGLPGSNTLTQMVSSFKKGFIFFELDVALDSDGILRCAHDPKNLSKYKNGDCNFQKVVKYVNRNDLFLIIDIKSDFKLTAKAIFSRVSQFDAKRLIFQLYQPDHIMVFKQFHERKNFAGPIVTLYRSRRSVDHVLSALASSGIKVVTIPRYRLSALRKNKFTFSVLTHPVHNCSQLKEVNDFELAGFYVTDEIFPKSQNLCD